MHMHGDACVRVYLCMHKGEQRETTTVGCFLCAQVTNKSISTTIKLSETPKPGRINSLNTHTLREWERESERVESERDVCWKKLGLDIMWRYGCVNNFFLLFHFDIGPRLNLHGGRVFSSVYVCECVPVRAWMCLAYRDWYMKKAKCIYTIIIRKTFQCRESEKKVFNSAGNLTWIQERTYTHTHESML